MLNVDSSLETLTKKLEAIYSQQHGTQYPTFIHLPDQDTNRRVLFLNSIGGLGDGLLILLAMQLYKHYFPQDTIILYDSLFLHHYYEIPEYVDEVYQATEHLHAEGARQMILDMDPSLPRHSGVALKDLVFTHIVSTHHAHQVLLGPASIVIKMDLQSMYKQAILHGSLPLSLKFKARFEQELEAMWSEITRDGRMIVGIHNRAIDPHKNLAVDEAFYRRELEAFAKTLVKEHGARLLLCGDSRLKPADCTLNQDYIDLDRAVPNVYYKLELLRRCAYFFAAPSGFSRNVISMRQPHQSPGVMCFASVRRYLIESLSRMYPGYSENGGGLDANLVLCTCQHPALLEFLLREPHSHRTILEFFEKLLTEFGHNGERSSGASTWVIRSGKSLVQALGDESVPPRTMSGTESHKIKQLVEEASQLLDNGRIQEAVQTYQRIVSAYPNSEAALLGLGNSLRLANDWSAAAQAYRRCSEYFPDNVAAHVNLGGTLRALGRRAEALSVFNRAIKRFPSIVELYYNRANLWLDLNKINYSITDYQKALELKPDFEAAAEALGRLLVRTGKVDLAHELANKWTQNLPNSSPLWRLMGFVCETLRRHGEAERSYTRAYQLDTTVKEAQVFAFHQKQISCNWENWEQRLHELLGERVEEIRPASSVMLPTSHETQHGSAVNWWRRSPQMRDSGIAPLPRRRKLSSKIRLGYLSAHFGSHVVSQAIGEVLSLHDRDTFEVHAYCYGKPENCPQLERLKKSVDQFFEVHELSDHQIAQTLYQQGIDILIDLSGFDRGGRPGIVNLRPAANQVSYLGFCGTMGSSSYDYGFFDEFCTPPETQNYFSEKLLYIPGGFLVCDRRREVDSTPTRAQCNLPEDAIVLCSFNNPVKLTPEMFRMWLRILKQAPQTILWQVASNSEMRANLERFTREQGVDPGRIVFADPVPNSAYLARWHLGDLFLNTSPVSAGLTGMDALWQGCPMVTVRGETLYARLGASLLHFCGFDDLICADLEQYEQLVLDLVSRPAELKGLRKRLSLQGPTSALFDIAAKTKAIEQHYRWMVER